MTKACWFRGLCVARLRRHLQEGVGNAFSPSSDALRQSVVLKASKNRVIFGLVSKNFSGINMHGLWHLVPV